MNTEIRYMYRDASNYKTHSEVRFAGTLSTEQRSMIEAATDGGSFLPAQVGLETLHEQFPSHYDDDHPWHEIYDIVETPAAPTQTETIGEFAERFREIEWDVASADAELDRWKEGTPSGPV